MLVKPNKSPAWDGVAVDTWRGSADRLAWPFFQSTFYIYSCLLCLHNTLYIDKYVYIYIHTQTLCGWYSMHNVFHIQMHISRIGRWGASHVAISGIKCKNQVVFACRPLFIPLPYPKIPLCLSHKQSTRSNKFDTCSSCGGLGFQARGLCHSRLGFTKSNPTKTDWNMCM